MKRFEVNICGEVWTVEFRPPSRMPPFGKRDKHKPRDWGRCDWRRRLILVNNSLSVESQGQTLLHEIQHAHNPHHHEDAVEWFEQAVKDAFERAGLQITRMDG